MFHPEVLNKRSGVKGKKIPENPLKFLVQTLLRNGRWQLSVNRQLLSVYRQIPSQENYALMSLEDSANVVPVVNAAVAFVFRLSLAQPKYVEIDRHNVIYPVA